MNALSQAGHDFGCFHRPGSLEAGKSSKVLSQVTQAALSAREGLLHPLGRWQRRLQEVREAWGLHGALLGSQVWGQ